MTDRVIRPCPKGGTSIDDRPRTRFDFPAETDLHIVRRARSSRREGVDRLTAPFRSLKIALAQSRPERADVAVVLGKLGFHPRPVFCDPCPVSGDHRASVAPILVIDGRRRKWESSKRLCQRGRQRRFVSSDRKTGEDRLDRGGIGQSCGTFSGGSSMT